MANHFWIVGSDTGVGKTIVTALFMRTLQAKGYSVLPYKPVQTGIITEGDTSYYEDTAFYQTFSMAELNENNTNTYSFKEPASPHYAAMLEGQTIDKNIILEQLQQNLSHYDHVICEGAGGLYVPLDAKQGYHFISLIKESNLPCVLVVRTGLGTINHTVLSLKALKNMDIPVIGIVFNQFEGTELEKNNIETIQNLTSLPFTVIPKLADLTELKNLQVEFFERLITL
ncbi:dethiobiotin synthase [Bacillus massilinigeriensis]|uniref:dethiobiotin synthase n=1 Tax=Bacillus mediterraneensis TaxID=1805474 RepID=UPI0008F96770|nr:dethiobiotin synthase [Bacillus mediterraneensis]